MLGNERGFDLTFPKVPLTGQERPIADLTAPDERSIRYRLDVEALQAPYLAIEQRLPATTPPKLLERIAVARNLAVYGFFCYEFHAVSLFWAVSCIEMALKQKFEEVNPGPFELRRKLDNQEEKSQGALHELEDKLRMKWRITTMRYFDYGFKALLMWAFRESVLPDDLEIPVQELLNGYDNRFVLKVFPGEGTEGWSAREEPDDGRHQSMLGRSVRRPTETVPAKDFGGVDRRVATVQKHDGAPETVQPRDAAPITTVGVSTPDRHREPVVA